MPRTRAGSSKAFFTALLAGLLAVCPAFPAPPGGPEIFLESFFRNQAQYEEAFARTGRVEAPAGVRAGIVPHHFLARNLMASFFQGLSHRPVNQVILVGPDHYRSFAPGSDLLAFTTLLPWRTPFGVLEPHRELIRQLAAEDDAGLNDRVFMREHSVWTLVPFVKRALPQARVLPLVLRNNREYEGFRRLGARLAALAGPETLLLVSSDFSHGGSEAEAARQDRESLALLSRLDPAGVEGVHCDCRPGLALLLGYLRGEAPAFTLLQRQTSLDLGAPPGQPLTSYVAGYFSGRTRAAARVLFVGDLFLDRHIRTVGERLGYDFLLREVKELLLGSDLVVANLEGPVTHEASVSQGTHPGMPQHFRFTFAPDAAKTLARHRIRLVNLGNNHTRDFGGRGLEETRAHLAQAGIDYFGVPGSAGERSLTKDLGGWKWAFVSFNQLAGERTGAVLEEIEKQREEADLVVVYAHWGQEYSRAPAPRQREAARAFIDRGADLVVGSHPHVVQEKEEYRGKMIYYSLGNFVFDQYFLPDTVRGLALRVKAGPPAGCLEMEEIPLLLSPSGQTRVAPPSP